MHKVARERIERAASDAEAHYSVNPLPAIGILVPIARLGKRFIMPAAIFAKGLHYIYAQDESNH